MPKPKKRPEDRREHPRQVKFTDGENAAFLTLADSVAAGGPRPLDAHLLLWLVEQECKRRGIQWPASGGIALAAQHTPHAAELADAPAPGELIRELDDAEQASPKETAKTKTWRHR